MVKYCSILLVKDDEQDEYQKYLLFYIISTCAIIFVSLTFFFLPLKSIDSRSYEVLHTISQYGVISNKDEWRNILELTR